MVDAPQQWQPVRTFISFSSKDEKYLQHLLKHLSALKQQGRIEVWTHHALMPGADWEPELLQKLHQAELVLLLISSDFMGSKYVQEKELAATLKRHQNQDVVVVPILVRPVDITDSFLDRLQALPPGRKNVVEWPKRDKAWVAVVQGLRGVLDDIDARRRIGQELTAKAVEIEPTASPEDAAIVVQPPSRENASRQTGDAGSEPGRVSTMKRFIITQEFLKALPQQFQEMPIYFASGGGMIEPGVVSKIDESWPDSWQPGNDRARLLVDCVEECRKLSSLDNQIKRQGFVGPRLRWRLSESALLLSDTLTQLLDILNTEDAERSLWPKDDVKLYKEVRQRLKQERMNSTFRRIRELMTAKVDRDPIHEGELDIALDVVLQLLGDCIILVNFVLNYKRVYTWIRVPLDAESNQVETMCESPLAVRWRANDAGHAIEMLGTYLAVDPRNALRDAAIQATEVYNSLVTITRLNLTKIWLREWGRDPDAGPPSRV